MKDDLWQKGGGKWFFAFTVSKGAWALSSWEQRGSQWPRLWARSFSLWDTSQGPKRVKGKGTSGGESGGKRDGYALKSRDKRASIDSPSSKESTLHLLILLSEYLNILAIRGRRSGASPLPCQLELGTWPPCSQLEALPLGLHIFWKWQTWVVSVSNCSVVARQSMFQGQWSHQWHPSID